MRCPHCQSEKTVKNGNTKLKGQGWRQRYLCRECQRSFNPTFRTL